MSRTPLAAVLAFMLVFSTEAGAQDKSAIHGRVIFKGNPANHTRLRINRNRDPNCAAKVKKIGTEKVVLNKKTNPITIRNVLISIRSGLGDQHFEPPKEPKILNQVGCQYRPHVLGIMEGQTLKVFNGDDTNHNIHFLPKKNREINVSQPKKDVDKGLDVKLVAEEPFKVKCDVHPWMGCHIAVFTHPFYDVTEKDGLYELKGVPPGKHEVDLWHETFGSFQAEFEVPAGESVNVDFIYDDTAKAWSVSKPEP